MAAFTGCWCGYFSLEKKLSGEDCEDLPENFVVFITEKDIFHKGLPIYIFERYCITPDGPMAFDDKKQGCAFVQYGLMHISVFMNNIVPAAEQSLGYTPRVPPRSYP